MNITTYKKEYDKLLIEHLEQGFSFESFCAVVNCGRRTLYDWVDKHESFKEAKEIGFQKGKRFFEAMLISKIRGKELTGADLKKSDTACLIFALKTRFHETYGDKSEIKNTGEVKIVIDQDDNNL